MNHVHYEDFLAAARNSRLAPWAEELYSHASKGLLAANHGDFPRWLSAFEALPEIHFSEYALDSAVVRAGRPGDLSPEQRNVLTAALQKLHPWRKGPFEIGGVLIDTEWRSDWKWERLRRQIQPLAGRMVLDVGCGSGYHAWRMAGAGAEWVVGIEPALLYVMQFFLLRRWLEPRENVQVLPLGIEMLPPRMRIFDTVFSMGILYHRRSPLDHLLELRQLLRPGGELVLETLVIKGDDDRVLVPEERYARMRNVWFIPALPLLERWVRRCGFSAVRTADISVTSVEEQRSTAWMRFESLADFLNPESPTMTVEGYPAPRRAVLLARAD